MHFVSTLQSRTVLYMVINSHVRRAFRMFNMKRYAVEGVMEAEAQTGCHGLAGSD